MHRFSGVERKNLANAIKADINQACVELYSENHRKHLGASVIGEDCNRRLVYSVRWMHKEKFDGRMLRLFNRGHREEIRFAKWLKAATFKLWGVSQDGEQIRISAHEQHYGGSLDGVVKLSEKYNLIDMPFLLEMKTHNDKSFKKLIKDGVKISKPKHFIQMSVYGEAQRFQYGIYLGINKNDDEIHVEVVELDWSIGKQRNEKARNAILARTLPSKIAATPSYIECKYCPMVGICHLNHAVDVNCRSCSFSRPVEAGNWFCDKWSSVIPENEIPKACSEWSEFK